MEVIIGIFVYSSLIIGLAVLVGGICSRSSQNKNRNISAQEELRQADYFMQTHNSYYEVMTDAGKKGEFIIGRSIDQLTGYKRILYNCYIPKPDGGTTEIDIILIHETGIYVIESKNYKGWIFGSENEKYWTQTLYRSNGYGTKNVQKNHFYNPVIQNKGHIKLLRQYLNMPEVPVYSYIVFGNEATLKKVGVRSPFLYVVTQRDALSAIIYNANCVGRQFSNEFIEQLYLQLFPFTQVSELQKMEHVNQVCKKKMVMGIINEE